MSEIPCEQNATLKQLIDEFAEVLKTRAHLLEGHGLSEQEFYDSGLFRGAIERVRGQFSASMSEKRTFVQHVLNNLQDADLIDEWDSAGGSNRHDYIVRLKSGRLCAIELKGCLDGNNTNIFERPPHADEFVVWSVCTNPSANPRHNLWSGIHTRLSAEIISRSQQVDGLIVLDMVCGTIGRPCPKIGPGGCAAKVVGPYELPPPCLYRFPRTIPSPRNNPSPPIHHLGSIEFFDVLARHFSIASEQTFDVGIDVRFRGTDVERMTTISQAGVTLKQSAWTPIRRS